MTITEYDKEIDRMYENLLDISNKIMLSNSRHELDIYSKEYNDELKKINKFKSREMNNILEDYKKTVITQAQEYIYELFEYAVNSSTSGSAVIYVDSERLAMKIDDIIEDEIGEYMLDHPEIYEVEGGSEWCIDAMFAGSYVPYWDGDE